MNKKIAVFVLGLIGGLSTGMADGIDAGASITIINSGDALSVTNTQTSAAAWYPTTISTSYKTGSHTSEVFVVRVRSGATTDIYRVTHTNILNAIFFVPRPIRIRKDDTWVVGTNNDDADKTICIDREK